LESSEVCALFDREEGEYNMTTTRKLSLTAATLILGSGLSTGLLAQNTASTTGQNPWNANEGPVTYANKASSLIGMDVVNPQNQKLGDVKDLVLELPSGRISYAVLSVGGFLGMGEKYIAVPPSAFSFSPNGKDLVLNADKAKIENAPGFAKNDWPDPKNPGAIHSAYWQSEAGALGAPGTYSSGTQSSLGNPNAASETFHGQITALDTKANTLTVQGPSGTRDFKVDNHATITASHNGNSRLTDLKVGYPVTIGYYNENGTYVAKTITRADMPATKE